LQETTTVDGLYGQYDKKCHQVYWWLFGREGSKWDDMGEISYFPGMILAADEYAASGSLVPGIIIFIQLKMQSWTLFLSEPLHNCINILHYSHIHQRHMDY